MDTAQMERELRDALGAHGVWKLKLRTAVNTGKSDTDAATAGRDDCCQFGKWLYGPSIDSETKAGKPYEVITRLHAEFHQTAGRVLEMATSGNKDRATDLLNTDFSAKSSKLTMAIAKWRAELKQR